MREKTFVHQGKFVSHSWVPAGGNIPYFENMAQEMGLRMGFSLTVKDDTCEGMDFKVREKTKIPNIKIIKSTTKVKVQNERIRIDGRREK